MSSKNFSKIKEDFALPNQTYLNNASQTLLPNQVRQSLFDYCNRFDIELEYESVRSKIKQLINSRRDSEIVFTHGRNQSINLIAKNICKNWHANDCVIVPESEHHDNLYIWQQLSMTYNFRFETVNVIKDGSLDLGHLNDILESCEGKILFSISHVSNSIGYVQPIKDLFRTVKEYEGLTVLDASLSIGQEKIDVQDIDADFLVFTAHKFYGPFGVGVLYGKHKHLEKLEPLLIGESKSQLLPWRLEIGKPNLNGVIALGTAIDWFTSYDLESFSAHNKLMNANFQMMLNDLDFVKVFHPGFYKGKLISFNVTGHYPDDVNEFLIKENVIIKHGFLNARPIVEEKFPNGVLRLSWDCYNNKDDVEQLKSALVKFYDKYKN